MYSFNIKLLLRGGLFIILLGLETFLWTQMLRDYCEHILPI